MREMKRLEERIESMMTLQKLIADRQLRELSDGGSTAALVASTRHDRSHSTTDTTTDTQPGVYVAGLCECSVLGVHASQILGLWYPPTGVARGRIIGMNPESPLSYA